MFGYNKITNDETEYRYNSPDTRVLFGKSIQENRIPVWTSEKSHHPFVTFQDTKNEKRIGISKDMLAYGLVTFADPGGGKTNLLNSIFSELLNVQQENDVIICFDTKGDYFSEFQAQIPDNEKIVIGTGEEYRKVTGYYNIFREIMPVWEDGKLVYTTDSDIDAFSISKQIFEKMDSQMQPIFPSMAAQIFCGVMVYMMRRYWRKDQSKLNNEELVRLLSQSTVKELRKIFEEKGMEDYRNCLGFMPENDKMTNGVMAYIASVVREIFVGPFAEHNSQKEFAMREVVTGRKRIVFIEYDLKRGEALAPIYGVMIDRALANALGGRQENRNNVYIMLDELLLLPELKNLSNSLNFGRSQGVKVLAGIQNISGLTDIYGEAGAKRILASFQNIFAFRVSDYDTRQFLKERWGTNYENHSFTVWQKDVSIQREGYTVEDWDILSLKLGEVIVGLKDEKPFLFRIPKYKSRWS